MGFYNGGINEDQTVLAFLGQGIEYAFPDATLTPSHIAVVHRGSGAVTFGKIAPRGAGSKNIEDRVQNTPVVFALRTASLRWQKRTD